MLMDSSSPVVMRIGDPHRDTQTEQFWLEAATEVFEIFQRKHADYGPNNIAKMGVGGITHMLRSKVERLENLRRTGAAPENESLRDTIIDIIDYGIILMLVLDKHWPACTEAPEEAVLRDLGNVIDTVPYDQAKVILEKLQLLLGYWRNKYGDL